MGGLLTIAPNPSVLDLKSSRLGRWSQLQQMQQDFWKRLRIEYLNELQVRSKWRGSKQNLQIDSDVLLKDEQLPPAQWVLGRVLEVHYGADGLVRVATVSISTTIFKRAISKIVPLPFNDCSDGSNGGRAESLNI